MSASRTVSVLALGRLWFYPLAGVGGMGKAKWRVAQDESDFEPYLTNVPAAVVKLFHRFVDLARACGQVTFELQRGVVVLRGTRRIFASVVPTERGLRSHR